MIPKKIHYCWFGRNPLPASARKCLESWKRCCPDYEIIEWNEDNFDVDMNAYTKMCYENKKYAFLSDYVRLIVIEEHGGIYVDTDVEMLKCFDPLLFEHAFLGFENDKFVASGLGFGAEKHNPVIQQMITEYDPLIDGMHGTLGCPGLNTNALIKHGLKLNGQKQILSEVTVYPQTYFNPMNSATGEVNISNNTYSIHRYSMSWLSPRQRMISRLARPFHRIFGNDCFAFLKREKSGE